MRKLGKVIHFTNRGLVLCAEQVPSLGRAVYGREGARVGNVLDLFGPVAAPYVVVKPTRRFAQAGLGKLIGKDLYIGE